MQRSSGILMPIFSLPSKYGIGDFGHEAYKFVDFLNKAGQKVWQILPLVQTGYGNSPYSSISSESFNPYFISPVLLMEQGLLTESEVAFSLNDKRYIDYSDLYAVRYPLLRSAFARFDKKNKAFCEFVKSKQAHDYALYMALKYASGQKHFYEWDDCYRYRDKKALCDFENSYKEEILFWQFVQFTAKSQWLNLKKYANEKGVSIMGDMPLYVALDSVDVWINPSLYKLEPDFTPKKVAGVPPDYFCEDGQLWGNPVYDYSVHEKDGFAWWKERVKKALTIFDYVRIDHFRGLDRYYEVPFGAENAKTGEWVDVPSHELLTAIHSVVDKDKIIAEDLGIIDDGVRDLLKWANYPGMKILSFAFNGEDGNLYLPENIEENYVCYTGTHDNDTLIGLIESASEWDYNNMVRGVSKSLEKANIIANIGTNKGLANSIINLGFNSKAKLFILPVQDLLGLGGDYRINEPGTVKEQNWSIKFNSSVFTDELAQKLLSLTKKYNR